MRALLLYLARREGFKDFALKFPVLQRTAWRFVAGETLDDAVRAVKEVNGLKMSGTLDLLGENTLSLEDARNATREIVGILDRIHAEKIACNVSVKLTQLGLALETENCLSNLSAIVRHARDRQNFVRVDMEDSAFTQKTIDIVRQVHREMDNVGAVIQAYLYRSENDVRLLLEDGIRIRLCKGAYLEPPSVAFRKKRDTDANFVRLMKLMLESGLYHAIATHDEAMIDATAEFAASKRILRDGFEFQMLYGVRRDLQQRLARDGYKVRVYIPYGRRWYPYFMRRLAERPANIVFILRNFLRG
ncbi:MAG: proline dehydrogenase family protein [Acidobacteria bacterium]|nr:proline dehydrogenase family protein [Acidobacteriota bacterium]